MQEASHQQCTKSVHVRALCVPCESIHVQCKLTYNNPKQTGVTYSRSRGRGRLNGTRGIFVEGGSILHLTCSGDLLGETTVKLSELNSVGLFPAGAPFLCSWVQVDGLPLWKTLCPLCAHASLPGESLSKDGGS